MTLKPARPNTSIQYRREVNRLFQPQGLGVIYSTDRKRTITQLAKRFGEMQESAQQEFVSVPSDPENLRKIDLYQKYQSGKINFNDFYELIKPYLPQNIGGDLGQDLAQIEYYNYIQQFRKLSKDEILQRAGVIQTLNTKIKLINRSQLTKEEKRQFEENSKERKKIIEEQNKKGYFLSRNEKNQEVFIYKGVKATPAQFSRNPFTPAMMPQQNNVSNAVNSLFSPAKKPDQRFTPRDSRFR